MGRAGPGGPQLFENLMVWAGQRPIRPSSQKLTGRAGPLPSAPHIKNCWAGASASARRPMTSPEISRTCGANNTAVYCCCVYQVRSKMNIQTGQHTGTDWFFRSTYGQISLAGCGVSRTINTGYRVPCCTYCVHPCLVHGQLSIIHSIVFARPTCVSVCNQQQQKHSPLPPKQREDTISANSRYSYNIIRVKHVHTWYIVRRYRSICTE